MILNLLATFDNMHASLNILSFNIGIAQAHHELACHYSGMVFNFCKYNHNHKGNNMTGKQISLLLVYS